MLLAKASTLGSAASWFGRMASRGFSRRVLGIFEASIAQIDAFDLGDLVGCQTGEARCLELEPFDAARLQAVDEFGGVDVATELGVLPGDKGLERALQRLLMGGNERSLFAA